MILLKRPLTEAASLYCSSSFSALTHDCGCSVIVTSGPGRVDTVDYAVSVDVGEFVAS